MPGLVNPNEAYVNACIQDLAGRLQECTGALQRCETVRDYANIITSIKQACDATWTATLPYHKGLK